MPSAESPASTTQNRFRTVSLAPAQPTSTGSGATVPTQSFESTFVETFSELADLFGNPRSHGQIYGLLFASPDPLNMEEIARRLDISIGSASQGLRVLEEIGAVKRDTTERHALFSAHAELKTLIAGFISRRLMPRLQANLARLEALKNATRPRQDGEDPDRESPGQSDWRLDRVLKWHRRAIAYIPLAQKMMGQT